MTTETACDRLERQWHEGQWWRAYFLARRVYRLALEAQPAQCEAVISPLRRGNGDGLVDAVAAFEMLDMAAMSITELRSLAGTLARELPLAAIFNRSGRHQPLQIEFTDLAKQLRADLAALIGGGEDAVGSARAGAQGSAFGATPGAIGCHEERGHSPERPRS